MNEINHPLTSYRIKGQGTCFFSSFSSFTLHSSVIHCKEEEKRKKEGATCGQP